MLKACVLRQEKLSLCYKDCAACNAYICYLRWFIFCSEKKIAPATNLYTLLQVNSFARRDNAVTHEIADGASSRRPRSRILTAIELHSCAPRRLFFAGRAQYIKPPRPTCAQPGCCFLLLHAQPRQTL